MTPPGKSRREYMSPPRRSYDPRAVVDAQRERLALRKIEADLHRFRARRVELQAAVGEQGGLRPPGPADGQRAAVFLPDCEPFGRAWTERIAADDARLLRIGERQVGVARVGVA